jgi:hypothetical protein
MKYLVFTLMLLIVLIVWYLARHTGPTRLYRLKQDPVGSAEAAHWLANLPLEKKRAYAAQLGHVVLESDTDDDDFVVAFGADEAPYRWALRVGRKHVFLYEDNSFVFVLRNDGAVKNQWGVWWSVKQPYDLESNIWSAVVFRKRVNPKGSGFNVWIPATDLRYVGPKLSKSDSDVLWNALPSG